MTRYNEMRDALLKLAGASPDKNLQAVLSEAASYMAVADTLAGELVKVARVLGYDGDRYADAFAYLQTLRPADVQAVATAGEPPVITVAAVNIGASGVKTTRWAIQTDGRIYRQCDVGAPYWEVWIENKNNTRSRYNIGPTGHWRRCGSAKVIAKLDSLLRDHLRRERLQ